MAFIHALHLVLYGLLVASNLLLIPIIAMGGYRIGELFAGSLGQVVPYREVEMALPVVAAFMAVGLVNGPLAVLAMHNPPPAVPRSGSSASGETARPARKPGAKKAGAKKARR